MIKASLCFTFFCVNIIANAQQVFFTSPVPDKETKSFYASIAIQGESILFNAPDYQLYSYNTSTGSLQWSYNLGLQSNIPPFFVGEYIWVTGREQALQLDATTGRLDKTLPFTVNTAPIKKDNMVYCTGIYDAGCLIAYDTKNDSVSWFQFLAHGCSITPYYFDDKIIANAEGNKWLELEYTGQLKDKKCRGIDYHYPSELPCAKEFAFLSHDGRAIKEYKDIELEEDGIDIARTNNYSFLLSGDQLLIMQGKGKIKGRYPLTLINDTLELDEYTYHKILLVNDSTISFIHSGHLFRYNFLEKKTTQLVDLSAYSIHQAILQEKKLWIISKENGRLYGLKV